MNAQSRNFQDYLERKRREYGPKFDPSDLDAKFVPAFESGERIRVKVYGEVKTGTVGVTTGWKPVFLLMHNCRCIGSSTLLNKEVVFTTEKRTRPAQASIRPSSIL